MPLNVLGRVVTGYPSAYSAAQNQPRRIRRQSIRNLQCDWNGAIPTTDPIVAVRWDTTSPWATYMSSPTIAADQRSVGVTVGFNFSGLSAIKCTVTLESGTMETYSFLWTVIDTPLYPGAIYSTATGPFTVTAEVP